MTRRDRRPGSSPVGTVLAVVFAVLATCAAIAWLLFVATGGLHL